MFWTITGWIIAFLSLLVNTLQLLKNSTLKKQNSALKQTVGDNSNAVQQSHLGKGDNISIGGNSNIKK